MKSKHPALIAPSILSADFGRLKEEIEAVEAAGADWIHVDVMDGHFVPNITLGPPVVASLKKYTKLPLDVHLMIENADHYIPEFRKAGADIISVHVEACTHLQRTLALIKSVGAKPAVVLNPATPLSLIEHVWDDIEMVLLMSVNPGFGGQSFIPAVKSKIKALRALANQYRPDLIIEVDGGVNANNIGELYALGANAFVAGNAIFSKSDYQKAMSEMRIALDHA